MKIREKFTLLFLSIVMLVLGLLSVAIYYFSANYREQDFHRRLKNRAINIVNVLMTVKEVDAELLKRLEVNNPASLPKQFVVIFNEEGDEMYRSQEVNSIIIEQELLERVKEKGEIWFSENNFEVVGLVHSRQGKSVKILAAADDVYGKDALYNLRRILLIAFFSSIMLFSLLGWIYAGRVLRPISTIVKEVNAITAIDLNRRLDEGNHWDELSSLANAFNLLLKRLQGVFLSQKYFIANASHEIKTPITVMTGEIEVTLRQERTKEYYEAILRSSLFGLKRLSNLSNQLLMLAQTSSETPEKNFSLLRIDDIFWDSKDSLQRAHPEYKIEILLDLDINQDALSLEGDEQLLKVAVQNLMENGCKYSVNHNIIIDIHSRTAGVLTASFVNQGKIDAQSIEKVFDPFFRGENSKQSEGFGIGLSLVYWVVRLHQGAIEVESKAQITRFTMTLPNRRDKI